MNKITLPNSKIVGCKNYYRELEEKDNKNMSNDKCRLDYEKLYCE